MITPVTTRHMVRHMQEVLPLSKRRACALVGVARHVARYVSAGADDAVLRHQYGPCEMQHPSCHSGPIKSPGDD
ncbi:hypothetical protein JK192_12220 [Gluconobacter cerinus]|uniref:hypothetical protein n=1 Tax=Gluconobacter cerinus TaxID=38307 RepID=UPI001B8D9470|nr:hypothetical protein [Gluconobacter cerinus]MBS1032144.1 hypothetical protein [Gluconobacter cerinus]